MLFHLVGLAFFSFLPISDGAWQQWRGPARDGVLDWALPDPLPKTLEKVWQVDVGAGYGSPVGAKNRLYLPVRKQDKEWLLCLNATTGELVWEKSFDADFRENSYATNYGKGPFATPLLQNGKVVLVTVTGQVHCLDADSGDELWARPFDAALTGERLLFCGNTVSPLAFEDWVIVHVGDETHGRMAAYHLETGKEVWAWSGDISGYASPALMVFEGRSQIVSATQNKVAGLDPRSGKLLWEYPWQVRWRENIVMPVQHGDGFIISGREQGVILKLNVAKNGDEWALTKAWESDALAMYMSSPVLIGDRLFGFSHKLKGHYFAMNAKTGDVLWQGPGRSGMNAVLLGAKTRLLGLSTEGELVVFPQNATSFEPLATYQVSKEQVWAHPLFLDGVMIVKGTAKLSAWRF